MIGLLTNSEGLPVATRAFKGNTAGHGDTVYKLYTIRNGQFRHFADIDKNGIQILKHKGNIGKNLPIKKFIGVK